MHIRISRVVRTLLQFGINVGLCTVSTVCKPFIVYVSWCGGESWVDQRVPRAYIHDVALLL